MAKLTIADIADQRAYDAEREEFRRHIIDVRGVRRVALGPIVSISFENAETMRFQVQEMARAERIVSDDRIQEELDTYNPLIPEEGHLSATLFLELTSKHQLEEWLPKLVGIEKSVQLRIAAADGEQVDEVPATTEGGHDLHLTRDDVTASVHYIAFALDAGQVSRFTTGTVTLVSVHPEYPAEAILEAATRDALAHDLLHGG